MRFLTVFLCALPFVANAQDDELEALYGADESDSMDELDAPQSIELTADEAQDANDADDTFAVADAPAIEERAFPFLAEDGVWVVASDALTIKKARKVALPDRTEGELTCDVTFDANAKGKVVLIGETNCPDDVRELLAASQQRTVYRPYLVDGVAVNVRSVRTFPLRTGA